MHKATPEMKRAAQFVAYEWRQFSWAAQQRDWAWCPGNGVGTGTDPESEDAVIEVLLLHARALRDFFTNSRPRPKFGESDILAEDFFDSRGEWTKPVFSYLTLERTKQRLDRALAHLSYDRDEYAKIGKNWDLVALISELESAWKTFLESLPMERREWFTWPHES